jgi:hypothetical protein
MTIQELVNALKAYNGRYEVGICVIDESKVQLLPISYVISNHANLVLLWAQVPE